VIGNDCTGSCKFNYHTTTTAEVQLRWKVIVLLILMEFMIITVYKLSFHINQWKLLVCWKYVFVGVHWMEFVSHVKIRQLQTQRQAYQNNTLSFATRLGWLATEFYDYTFSISLSMLNIKLCQQLKHWHQSINKYIKNK
jgi:hypothetical protein